MCFFMILNRCFFYILYIKFAIKAGRSWYFLLFKIHIKIQGILNRTNCRIKIPEIQYINIILYIYIRINYPIIH